MEYVPVPQISLPRPRTTSPTARNSSAFSLCVSVGDSPVEPATTIASLPVSRRCEARRCAPSRSSAWSSSRNGVTIAVISDPNLPVMRPPSPPKPWTHDGPMLAPDAAHLHQDRRRRLHGPPLRRTDLQGRPGDRGLRHHRRGRRRPRARPGPARRPRPAGRPLVLQRELFVVGADLAANPKKRKKLEKRRVPRDRRHGAPARAADRRPGGPAARSRRSSSCRARTRRARRWTWPAASSAARSAG